MTPAEQFRAKVEARRKATYRAVRAMEPALYERAVEIGHLALSAFERDENKRAANVEGAVMSLIAELRGVEVIAMSDHARDADREMLGRDADHFDGEIGNK